MCENKLITKKVVGYIRLSKEDEKKYNESESVKNQRDYINDYSEKNSMNIDDYYIDDGYTGSNFERPGFKKLIKDIEIGLIKTVITKDTSRLGRDFIETGHYIFKYFPDHNIRFISILENFDTTKPNGVEDIIPFQTVINDIFLKDLSRKIKSIRQNKMRQGLFVGSTISYGYKRDKNNKYRLVVDEYAANVVKKIFSMRLQGMTNTIIARKLTEEGILTPSIYNRKNIKKTYSTNIWKPSSIAHIIQNEVYIGNMIQRKFDKVNYKSKKKYKLPKQDWIRVENVHEPIIDKEVFRDVQNLKIKEKGLRIKKYNYILKGLVYCSDCGIKMTVRKNYKNNKFKKYEDKQYYCCRTNIMYRSGKCSLHYFKEQKLNKIVIGELIKIFNNNINVTEIEKACKDKRYLNKYIQKLKSKCNNIKNNLLIIERAIKDLYKDRANNIISNDEFYIIKYGLNKEKKEYLDKEKKFNLLYFEEKNKLNNWYKKELDEFIKLKNPSKNLMSQLIKKIEIDNKKNVKIFFNFDLNNKYNTIDLESKNKYGEHHNEL